MNVFFTFVFNIFILVIIGALIDSLVVNEKLLSVIRPAVNIIILLTIIGFVSNTNISNDIQFSVEKYNIDKQAVWDEQAKICEEFLEKEMIAECSDNNININDIDIDIRCENNKFDIICIKIIGPDRFSAKNYISGKYRIGLAYINTDGE